MADVKRFMVPLRHRLYIGTGHFVLTTSSNQFKSKDFESQPGATERRKLEMQRKSTKKCLHAHHISSSYKIPLITPE